MADPTDYTYDEASGRNIQTRFKGAGTNFDATKDAKRQDVTGLAKTIKQGQDQFVPPKQIEGEDSGAYGARISLAREAYRQKKAMGQ